MPPEPAPKAPDPSERRLVRRQVLVVAVVLLVSLALSRLSAHPFEAGFTALLFILIASVLTAAVWSVFVRRWLAFSGAWLMGFLALSVGGLLLLCVLNGETLGAVPEASLYLLIAAGYGLTGFVLGGLSHAALRRWRR